MPKPKVKLALAMIVKASDDEADLLSRALNTIADHVDGIFITITGKNDRVDEVARMYGAKVSYFKWVNDFAAARNFNFKQVPKDFTHILWQDADDVIRGAEKLKRIVRDNPDVDAFGMTYLYAFDENKNPVIVHLKTQIVKNDDCVEWAGELHEDFKQNREMTTKAILGVERLHLTDDKRAGDASKRNLEIAIEQAKKHPNDPRVFWNLGNSYKGVGKNKEAMENFDKFLATSRSEDEKYIALIRMAEILMQEKEYAKALESAKMAIGTKPEYPDAYYTRGNVFFEMKDWASAKESYTLGLKKKPPIYEIIVYNPRDYDYIPLKNLARIYFNMNMPTAALTCLEKALEVMPSDKDTKNLIELMRGEAKKLEDAAKAIDELAKTKTLEELKVAMDALPDEVKAHPAICSIRNQKFVKTSSSGHDIAFYCGPTSEEWDPGTAKEKGIGGSEEAIINLSKGLAKRGWKVTVYNSCGFKEKEFDGVIWRPFWMWNYNDKQDVVVIWRSPRPTEYPINAKKIYVDLHDAIGPGEFNEARLKKITKIMVKSKAHRDLFPSVPDDKFFIAPNGVDLTLFDEAKNPERDPYLIANFSSPDRSLSATMDIFEEAYKRAPGEIRKKMKLMWHYGWGLFDTIRTSAQEKEWGDGVKGRFEALKKKGIAVGGDRINHGEVARANLKAGCMLYPSEFYEIDWIGGSKAQIGGMWPITTSFAAIGEKIQFGVKIKSEKTIENWSDIAGCDYSLKDPAKKEIFVQALLDYLERAGDLDKEREEMSKWARAKFDIEKIVDLWHDELRK